MMEYDIFQFRNTSLNPKGEMPLKMWVFRITSQKIGFPMETYWIMESGLILCVSVFLLSFYSFAIHELIITRATLHNCRTTFIELGPKTISSHYRISVARKCVHLKFNIKNVKIRYKQTFNNL